MWKPSTTSEDVLMHSDKGTSWKNHKYIKKIGNVYIYAKTAAKHHKESEKYHKKYKEAQKEAGSALSDSVSARMGHPDYNYRSKDGKDNERSKKAATEKAEMATRYRDADFKHGNLSNRYNNLAKQELASIPKEMISDGKKLVSSLFSKKKKK